jgi:hypothetical protein
MPANKAPVLERRFALSMPIICLASLFGGHSHGLQPALALRPTCRFSWIQRMAGQGVLWDGDQSFPSQRLD